MIFKSFELDKKDISKINFCLIYGENEGLKKDIINKIKNKHNGKEIKYEETYILKNIHGFYGEIKNKSLFDEKRIYIIDRCTEKILEIAEEISEKETNDLIIINCGVLDKRSKLRNLIEKSNSAIIIPTYKDNTQSLINIAKKFFTEKKINISYETLNLLVNRCNGDRGYLNLELAKVTNYAHGKKIISLKEISALTNLSENYSANELVDASLSKNINKTCEILNENNYSQEDSFFILRIFLQKAKKILSLLEKINCKEDIDRAITDHRPPIFWKDKPVIKKQLQLWSIKNIQYLISQLNDIEKKIKLNNSVSLILMKNFIFEIIELETNSYS